MLKKYESVVNSIKGWYEYKIINPVLEKINKIQENIDGNLLEICVYHGKSFIPLATLTKNNEKSVAIDVFEDQHLIEDFGRYNGESINIFKQNLKKIFNEDFIEKNIIIEKNDSMQFEPINFLNICNNNLKYRLISIDGCHSKKGTLKDLENSSKIICEKGVIICDDYLNKGWPGVKEGVDEFLKNNSKFIPFYNNGNKFMICEKEFFDLYKNI